MWACRLVPVTAVAMLAGLTGCSVRGAGPGVPAVTRKAPITRPVGVSGDGRVLTVTVESGGCDGLPRLKVSETAGNVLLTAWITTRTGPDAVCPAVARAGRSRAVLRTALGRRTVTDAASGHRLSLRRARRPARHGPPGPGGGQETDGVILPPPSSNVITIKRWPRGTPRRPFEEGET